MYFYNIGYHSCEESSYREFVHEKKFSKGELFDIVEDCLYTCLKIEAREKEELRGKYATEEDSFIYDRSPSLQDILGATNDRGYVFVEEMGKRGFRRVEYEQNLSLFGWASSLDPQDWDGHTDEDTREMITRLKERYEEESA